MNAVLTNYPLTREFQQRLSTLVKGDVVNLTLAELNRRPILKLLADLRALHMEAVYLPLEDANGIALLPVLKLVASIIPAHRIYLVNADMRLQRISRLDAAGSVFRLAYASVFSRVAVARARREVNNLLGAERMAVEKVAGSRVLYLNANLWFGVSAGGSIGHISGVVNAMQKAGYEVSFASASGRLMINDSVSYIGLVPPADFGIPPEFNHYRFHFNILHQLKSRVAFDNVDFIYQRLSIANYSGVVLSRSKGIPLVLEYNGSEAWIARNWGRPLREQVLAEQIEEINLRHAHLIVTISDVLRDELLKRGVDRERIVTYPNCIDPEIFNPSRFTIHEITALRASHGIASDAVVVTFVGTFGQWHGTEVLAQAIRQLIDKNQVWIKEKKVHFLLVGDGLRMPEVKTALGDHVYGPFVTLAGLVPQHKAPLYLAASDILSSPHVPNADSSKFFGSPTKLFEYMAMGKAIVASDLAQIGDVLENSVRVNLLESEADSEKHNRTALLIEPGNVEQLCEGIIKLVDNSELRKVLGRGARLLALKCYTWERHVEEILNGLRRCDILERQ